MDKKKIIVMALCFVFFILLMMGINYLIDRSEQQPAEDVVLQPQADVQVSGPEGPVQPEKQKPVVQEQSDPQTHTGPLDM